MYKKRKPNKEQKGLKDAETITDKIDKNLRKANIKMSKFQRDTMCEKIQEGFYFSGTAPAVGGCAIMMSKNVGKEGYTALDLYPCGIINQYGDIEKGK